MTVVHIQPGQLGAAVSQDVQQTGRQALCLYDAVLCNCGANGETPGAVDEVLPEHRAHEGSEESCIQIAAGPDLLKLTADVNFGAAKLG
jgi:hypothetical protein